MEKLNAMSLKAILWKTLQSVKNKEIDPVVANAVAVQAREILRTIKIQMEILKDKHISIEELNKFASEGGE